MAAGWLLYPLTAKNTPKSEVKNYAGVLVREAGAQSCHGSFKGAIAFCRAEHTLPYCARVEEAKEQYSKKTTDEPILDECCIVHPQQSSTAAYCIRHTETGARYGPYIRSTTTLLPNWSGVGLNGTKAKPLDHGLA
jgi:hypothetical protein